MTGKTHEITEPAIACRAIYTNSECIYKYNNERVASPLGYIYNTSQNRIGKSRISEWIPIVLNFNISSPSCWVPFQYHQSVLPYAPQPGLTDIHALEIIKHYKPININIKVNINDVRSSRMCISNCTGSQ